MNINNGNAEQIKNARVRECTDKINKISTANKNFSTIPTGTEKMESIVPLKNGVIE